MKKSISSLELSYLVKELKELEGSRLNKVYQVDKDFLFDFHKPREGKKQLRVKIPLLMWLTKYKPDFPDTPPKFCMFLRKRLSGMFLDDVRQVGFDRIVELVFRAGDKEYLLIVELFSKGNLVLCEEDYSIVAPLQSQTWQARTIRGGTKYEYPPEQLDPRTVSFDEFWHVFEESEMDSVVKSLAVDFGLGGTYAEEVCARAGVDKNLSTEELVEEKAKELFDSLVEVLSMEIMAVASGDRVYPFDMVTVAGEETFDSFNEAIDDVVSKNLVEEKKGAKEEVKKERLDKVKNVIEQQEKTIRELKGSIKDNKRKGELIFENYQELSQLLYDFRKDVEELSWDEVKEKYRDHDLVEQVNDSEGLVIVDL